MTRRIHRYKIKNISISKNLSYIPQSRSNDIWIRKKNRATSLASSTNEETVTLFARYVRALLYSRPRYETKTEENPILHCHGQYHQSKDILSHFTVTAKGSRWTGQRHGWPPPRERGDWSIDSRTHTAHSLRDRVSSLSWSNRLRYYRDCRDSRDDPDEPRSSNKREPCRWIRRATE